MGFEILSGAEKKMYPGQIIQYIVTPILGIRTKWVTEITHVREGKYFVDEPRFGPYSLWHHTHTFEEKDGGTVIKDNLTYAIPMGLIGRIVNFFYIRHDIQGIFKYRHKILDTIFSEIKNQSGKSL